MIPHLNKLPLIPEEEPPLKKLGRPAVVTALVLMAGIALIWLFHSGVKKLADEDVDVIGGLRSVAADLWTKGAAPEIRFIDPDLVSELTRLRERVGLTPAIVVAVAENRPGQPEASHEIVYLQDERQVLAVRVYLDVTEGRMDVLTYRTGPEFTKP